MPRKKRIEPEAHKLVTSEIEKRDETPKDAVPPETPANALDEQPKTLARPYRSIFTSSAGGFELGENFRFKQRVFTFADTPLEEIRNQLKAAGFTYRPSEKSWTIQSNNVTREISDRLARSFQEQLVGAEKAL